jgi:hypothetical protein
MRTLFILLALLPDDAARRYVEEITAPKWEYRVTQGGTMDGVNCRSPLGGGFGIWTQSWESNRSVRLENIGDTDVINPWLSNGRNDFRSVKEIVEGAVQTGMTDRERAIALWRRQTTHRFHAGAGDPAEMHDPVKVFNVYGYTTCGDDAVCLAGLWHAAGFPVSPGRLLSHRTSQVFYDGRWHLLDGDLGPVYLLRDNTTIAAEQDLVRDHDLIKRSHSHGILDPDRRADNEEHAAVFVSEDGATPDRGITDIVRNSTMNMVLRPHEAIVWRWGRGVKYHGHEDIDLWGPRKAEGRVWGAPAAERICNGLWEYRPDFGRDGWRNGAEGVTDVAVERGGLVAGAGKTGSVVWRMRSPYVFVGGRLETAGAGAKFFVSWDGSTWHPAGESFDPLFPAQGPARYDYRLKCELPAGARLERLTILNDLQMAPLALPGMQVGENRFTYSDASPGARKVRLTHEWVERSLSRPPAAPAAALFPIDGDRAEGTDLVFQWRPSEGGEGGAIADYHFELSDRADLAWPLSSNFEKLVSNTADPGRARYRTPSAGLLRPGETYYWHVRARNDQGVWGPWSRTWSFRPGGPAAPLDLRLEPAGDGRRWVLRWKPNAAGRKPLRYRVYGSDEKGFSVSDEPYAIAVGRSKQMPSRAQANFVAETEQAEMIVLGPGVDLPNANKAFYRVVALDDAGGRSGASDYAAAPRPIFITEPRARARPGAAYRSQVSVVRSLGDLRLQWVDGEEMPSFWDIEKPLFALKEGPSWLRIDERTGALDGVPDVQGTFEVAVSVSLERSVRRLDESGPHPWNLGWGKDKTLGIVTESAGGATQRFRITVGE